jgi:hypothetical protein
MHVDAHTCIGRLASEFKAFHEMSSASPPAVAVAGSSPLFATGLGRKVALVSGLPALGGHVNSISCARTLAPL